MRLFTLLAVLFAWAGTSPAKDLVQLRAIDPKPFYKPGDTIVLEMRCAAGVTDAEVKYNPTREDIDAGMYLPEEPKCPFSRFEIFIPTDFLGKNDVSVLARYRDKPHSVRFEFEVRSETQPSALWFSTDSLNEGCNSFYLKDENGEPPRVGLFSVLPDGTRLDLCREGKADLKAIPSAHGAVAMKDGLCTLTLKKPGPLKVVASYRGLRKEWTCTEARPETRPDTEQFRTRPYATPHPAPKISVEEFLQDPRRLDRNPMDVGSCRLLQHWDTGYCYVYNLIQGGKVSVHTDARCTELDELRRRMALAIEQGHCLGPEQGEGRLPAP